MISDGVVDEVRLRADLVEVVGEVVSLRRSGKDWKGQCPFHDDRSPSFYVVPDKGFYKCFGCGEAGDVFSFLMKRQGMEFLDAVRHLGERYGVEIREEKGKEAEDPHRALYEANAFAREWFRARLLDPEGGQVARDYLAGRGIGAEVSERFSIGFAPDDWRQLRDAAARHGIGDELLLEVGLVTTSERSREPYDRFRGRIVFPIEATSGRTVGFGGRVIDGGGTGVPKYLNSPESPIYHKGAVLYGLSWNRNAIRREGVALIVEGYMDVVALASAGVEHAVAALGTAITDEHARLLNRYTGKALLLFDSDEAGERASFRAADILLAWGIHPSVVTFPPGEDPDSVVRAEGAEGLARYLDAAVDVLDRKLHLLDERGYFGSIERMRTAVDKLLPTLRSVRDPALRDIYVASVAKRTGVRRETLEEEVARSERTGRVTGSASEGPGRQGVGAGGAGTPSLRRRSPRNSGVERLGPERQLLLVLLRNRGWVDRALERIGVEEFRDPSHRAIFGALADDPEMVHPPEGFPPEALARFEVLMADPEDVEHTERVFHDALAKLQDRAMRVRRESIFRRLREAASPEEERELGAELTRLRRERMGEWGLIRREGPVGVGRDEPQVDE